MKKLISTTFLVAFLSIHLFSQKKINFEGIVKYDITFEASGLPKEAMDMMKGAEMVTFIKGDFRRIDLNLAIQSTSSIVNSKEKNIVTLMDIIGQKYLIRTTEADLKKEEEKNPAPVIEYIDGIKQFAGYNCKTAKITTKSAEGREDIFIVYYTEEIPAYDIKSPFAGLKGFPLAYNVIQGGINMTFSAKSVSKESVSDSKFEIPKEGYKETTLEDFQKEIGKMTGGQ